MTNIPPKVRARVAAGIALLDQHGPPDWRKQIDLNKLHIALPTFCVLGQLYGHYEEGMGALERKVGGKFIDPHEYGFYAWEGLLTHANYGALDAAWQEALAA